MKSRTILNLEERDFLCTNPLISLFYFKETNQGIHPMEKERERIRDLDVIKKAK